MKTAALGPHMPILKQLNESTAKNIKIIMRDIAAAFPRNASRWLSFKWI